MLRSASIGTIDTKFIVIRGNIAAGKTTVTHAIMNQSAEHLTLVEQDYLRKVVIGEHDRPGGLTPALISKTVQLLLDHGFHVLLEGVLPVALYGDTIKELIAAHRGQTHLFYLEVSVEETILRHSTRPKAIEFGADEIQRWYLPDDRLRIDGEVHVAQMPQAEAVVALIGRLAGLPLII